MLTRKFISAAFFNLHLQFFMGPGIEKLWVMAQKMYLLSKMNIDFLVDEKESHEEMIA